MAYLRINKMGWIAILSVAILIMAIARGIHSHSGQDEPCKQEVSPLSNTRLPQATAIVRIQSLDESQSSALCPHISMPDQQALRQALSSAAQLGQVLDVAVTEPNSREIRVAISCADTTPQLACDTANRLAQQYREQCRDKLQADMDQVCAIAHAAVTKARSERDAAQASAALSAEKNCIRLAQEEQSAWEARSRLPHIDLLPAQPSAEPTLVKHGVSLLGIFRGLMSLAMIMALSLAAVLVTKKFLVADQSWSSIREIQEALPIPIAGVIDSLPQEPVTQPSNLNLTQTTRNLREKSRKNF